MKRKMIFLSLCIIAAVFLPSCGPLDGSIDDPNDSPSGFFGKTYPVYDENGKGVVLESPINFTQGVKHHDIDSGHPFLLEAKNLTPFALQPNGMLKIDLQSQIPFPLEPLSGPDGLPPSVKVEGDIRVEYLGLAEFVSDGGYRLRFQKSEYDFYAFFYADRSVKANGSWSNGGDTTSIDITLKKGWNLVLIQITSSGSSFSARYTSINPDSNYRWTLTGSGTS